MSLPAALLSEQRRWWRRPALRDDDEREVGWLELFYDLVFVVVISRLAHHLGEHADWRGLAEFSVQFFGVFWIWNASTYYDERFANGGIEGRLLTFLAILPVAALAVFAEGGLGESYEGFTWAYLAARAVNMLDWTRASRTTPVFRPIAARFLTGFVVTVVLLVAGFGLGDDARLALFALAVATDVFTPFFTRVQQAALPPLSTSKFPERFGLFTIIVLGESVIGVINGLGELREAGELAVGAAVPALLGLAVGFGLWWVYFDFIARRPPRPVFVVALGWVYLHLGVVTAITVTGVGISAAISDAVHGGLERPSQRLLAGGVGAALVVMAVLEGTLHRGDDEPTDARLSPRLKLVAGALVLVLGLAPLRWGAAPLLAVLVAALAAQALYGTTVWYRRGPPARQGP